MALVIRANSLGEKISLRVEPYGVLYQKTAFMGGTRQFTFDQIAHVLMSRTGVLSFQVGNEVFDIQTRPDKRKHQEDQRDE